MGTGQRFTNTIGKRRAAGLFQILLILQERGLHVSNLSICSQALTLKLRFSNNLSGAERIYYHLSVEAIFDIWGYDLNNL